MDLKFEVMSKEFLIWVVGLVMIQQLLKPFIFISVDNNNKTFT